MLTEPNYLISNYFPIFSQSHRAMIPISGVCSVLPVSLRCSTAFVRVCLDCGHFVFPLAWPCPPHLFFFFLSSSAERSLCAAWTEGGLYDLWKPRSCLAHPHKVRAVCQENVADLHLLLVKTHVNQWFGVAAKPFHLYLWLLSFEEWCNT